MLLHSEGAAVAQEGVQRKRPSYELPIDTGLTGGTHATFHKKHTNLELFEAFVFAA